MKKDSSLSRAWAIVLGERHGVLSTAHVDLAGWPFGSITPYALTEDGDPILFLSDISEHYHNLKADARASLLIPDSKAGANPQAGARIALLGKTSVPEGEAGKKLKQLYFKRFPGSKGYTSAHGFEAFLLNVERVRWILGFGTMGWTERPAWLASRPEV